MKMNIPKAFVFVLALGCGVAVAKDDPRVLALKETLSKVPAAEVPAKAADIVLQAEASQRDAIAADVVKASLKKNSTTAPAVVGAICRKSPETAPTVAATAASSQPRQAVLIARAAAAAAPAQAGEIVKAVCKAVPSSYRDVALTVAQVAPKAAKEILAGLSEAMPALKGPIDQAIASYSGQPLVVASVLDRVPSDASRTALASPGISLPAPPPVSGPSVGGAPYVNISGTPQNINPANNNVVGQGGRSYRSP